MRAFAVEVAPLVLDLIRYFTVGLKVLAGVLAFVAEYGYQLAIVLALIATYFATMKIVAFIGFLTTLGTTVTAVTGLISGLGLSMAGIAAAFTVAVPPIMAVAAAILVVAGAVALLNDQNNKSDEQLYEDQLEGTLDNLKAEREKRQAHYDNIKSGTHPADIATQNRLQAEIRRYGVAIDNSQAELNKYRQDKELNKLGLPTDFKSMADQMNKSGENNLKTMIDGIEAGMKKFRLTQNNNVTVNTQVDDKGKSQLSPEALEHSLDKAMRSLFDIKVTKVAQLAL
jgi:hypothetical protein